MLELSSIHGFGPMRLKALSDRGIKTAEDLLSMLPKEYRDTTHPLSPGQFSDADPEVFDAFLLHCSHSLRLSDSR